MLRVQISVPRFEFEVRDPLVVVESMTAAVAARIRSRAQSGQGSNGALPKPKGGGQPLRRTGALLASIDYAIRSTPRGPLGVVRAMGSRPPEEQESISRKRIAARLRTRGLRAAAVLGAFAQHASGHGVSGNRLKKRGSGIALGKVRVRTVIDNASLAAILSSPPRDLRSRNGRRGIYRVFSANDGDQVAAEQVAQQGLRADLVGRGVNVIGGV